MFRKKRPITDAPALLPPEHKRVAMMADRFNHGIVEMETMRAEVLAEIADKQEELRQLEQGLKAYRAALSAIVDDPTIPAIANLYAQDNVENGAFDTMERELSLAGYKDLL